MNIRITIGVFNKETRELLYCSDDIYAIISCMNQYYSKGIICSFGNVMNVEANSTT